MACRRPGRDGERPAPIPGNRPILIILQPQVGPIRQRRRDRRRPRLGRPELRRIAGRDPPNPPAPLWPWFPYLGPISPLGSARLPSTLGPCRAGGSGDFRGGDGSVSIQSDPALRPAVQDPADAPTPTLPRKRGRGEWRCGRGVCRPQGRSVGQRLNSGVTEAPSFRGAGTARKPGIDEHSPRKPSEKAGVHGFRAPPFGRPRNDDVRIKTETLPRSGSVSVRVSQKAPSFRGRPTGPACGRPEDKLRAEPGIDEHRLFQDFRGLCSWVPGLRAARAPE